MKLPIPDELKKQLDDTALHMENMSAKIEELAEHLTTMVEVLHRIENHVARIH